MADNTTLYSGDVIRDVQKGSGPKTTVVVVDQGGSGTESLMTAAAMADAVSNPTVLLLSAAGIIYNGSTWDRQRSVVNGQDSDGTGITAAGLVGQYDDILTGAVTENQFAPVRISRRRALLVEGVADGLPMNVALSAGMGRVEALLVELVKQLSYLTEIDADWEALAEAEEG